MKLQQKLHNIMSSGNALAFKKALGILGREFDAAISNDNTQYAKELVQIANSLYDQVSKFNDPLVMVPWSKKLKIFIDYWDQKIKY